MMAYHIAMESRFRPAVWVLLSAVFAVVSVSAMAADEAGGVVAPAAAPVLGANATVAGVSEADLPPEVKILKNIEKEIKKKKGKDVYQRSTIPSLIFTPSQYALLQSARAGFNTRPPSKAELRADPNDPNYRPLTNLRDISLGGIAFSNPDDWTIWLNNMRVTPDNLPSEAIDLRVYKDFIEIKWFDAKTNQVYPIRLRPNQKFNLDTRIFLPG